GRVCVGGRCADPRCTPESAEFCPAPLCEEAADCPAAADCNSNVCVVGACLSTFGGICDAGTADAGSPDAGPPDAGPPPESRPADSRACQPMCAPPSGRRVNGWLCTGRVFYANFEFRQATCVAGRCVDETEVARLECVCNDGTPEPECDGTPGCESLDARSGCDDPDVSGGRIPCPFVGDYRDPGCFPE
ncbi:MAG: hypothetical protein AB8I08_18185, partial [Sandaracinaceae bacterium]